MSDEPRINFYFTDDNIMVFEFFKMDRKCGDLFAKIVRSGHDNVPDKARVLYDFQNAELPSPYFISIQGTVYNEFPHPDDEKSAYITGSNNNEIWVQILRDRFDSEHDRMRIFKDRESAMEWLRD